MGPAWGRPTPERSVCLTAAAGGPAATLLFVTVRFGQQSCTFPVGSGMDFSPGLAVLTVREGTHPCLGPGSLLEPPVRRATAAVPRCCGGGACGSFREHELLPGAGRGGRGLRPALWPKPLLGRCLWRCPWGPCTAPEQVALSCRRAVLVQGRSWGEASCLWDCPQAAKRGVTHTGIGPWQGSSMTQLLAGGGRRPEALPSMEDSAVWV